jgi:hypothetical protein
MNKISHSQASKFQKCSQAWKYWYKDKIRPTTTSAALILGTAVDRAFTKILDKEKPEEFMKVYDYNMRFTEINGKKVYIPNSPQLVYSDSEFDYELLDPTDIQKLKEEYKIEDLEAEYKKLTDEKEYMGYDGLPQDRRVLFNHFNWYSLYRKGILMLDAIQTKVIPKFTHIYSNQERISLSNADGDEIVGFVDLVASYEGYEGPIVFDLKTSSIEYDEDSVIVSPQLSLYVHALKEKYNTRKAGYLVISKRVIKNRTKLCSLCKFDGSGGRHKTCANEVDGKRCGGEWIETIKPEVSVKPMIDDIPEQTEDLILENFDDVNRSMKSGNVIRNLQACKTFYGKCEYFDLCYRGKMDKLIKL